MKNEIAVKVYKVDYDFIIKNYLSPALWEKTWTLFVYRDIFVTLNISYISVKPRKICFEIAIKQDEYKDTFTIWYWLDNSNYNVLKKQINGAIESLITQLETHYIRKEDDYREIEHARHEERDRLCEIANDFLDSNGVTNKDIREVYVDNYVSNNEKTYSYLSNYIQGRKYRVMSDLWLVYYKATENNEKYQQIINTLNNEVGLCELLTNIKESIAIFKEDVSVDTEMYEAYMSEMIDCLESI